MEQALRMPATTATTTAAYAAVDASVTTTPSVKQDAEPRGTLPIRSSGNDVAEPVYDSMWRFKKEAGQSVTQGVEVTREEGASFGGLSFVLEGRYEILIVHGYESNDFQRNAAATKAHAIREARLGQNVAIRVIDLGPQQDHCTFTDEAKAAAEAKPFVDCPFTDGTGSVAVKPHAPVPNVDHHAKMWQIQKKAGTSTVEEVIVEWGAELSKDRSFVLDGKDEVLVVHGSVSTAFLRNAAAMKAHAIRHARIGQNVAIQVLDLGPQQDHCTAVAEAKPRVDCH